jgi:hypothetical protein
MSRSEISCEKLTEIELRHAEGLSPTPAEQELYERHLRQCDRCRLEREALGALVGDGNSGPLPALDDIARRRYVDQVLGRFDDTDDEPLEEPSVGPRKSGRRWLVAAASAVAAAAVLALVLVSVLDAGSQEPLAGAAGSGAPDPLAGRVVLIAGEPSAAGSAVVGQAVAAGDRIACRVGPIVITLPTGVTAALGPGTRITARRLDDASLGLDLETGSLLVSAIPGRVGPPLEISTRAGTVTVTGTVLEVEDRDGDVEVRVIRGRVEIADGVANEPRAVGPAEVALLGRGGVRPTGEQESASAWERITAFDLLDPQAGAVVDVRSVPAGALVSVDGADLGRTPVAAAVRAGHRKLEVTLDGRVPVREFVDVLAGQTLTRAFDLLLADQQIAALTDDAGPADRAPGAESVAGITPAEMLARAQSLRAERDWPGAARAYRELIRRHPGSDAARSSLVSVAQIELAKLGRPARALKSFGAYLTRVPGGPLTLEAMLGRARALRALGRTDEERVALKRFLDRFPDALQAAQAQARLESLSAAEPAAKPGAAKK